MTEGAATLDYASIRKANLGKPSLEESHGQARVVYPVSPTWFYIGMIALNLLIGAVKLGMAACLAWVFWSIRKSSGSSVPADLSSAWVRWFPVEAMAVGCFGAAIFWGIAVEQWLTYRKFGRFPVSLTASDGKLTKTWLGWWRPRGRNWNAEEISSIELRPVDGDRLRRWKTTATLLVHLRSGKRLRFRLTSRDATLATRIALAVGGALGREVKLPTIPAQP